MNGASKLFAAVLLSVAGLGDAGAAMLAPGAPFPAFELRDDNGGTVRSSDLAGKRYLVWFYPKAQTPGCTTEARGLRDHYAELEKARVVILGVSFDVPDANKKFVEAESLPFRLLSDTDRKLAVAVGAADSADAKVAKRISYLVGADGKVEKAYDDVQPAEHAKQVLGDCSAAAK